MSLPEGDSYSGGSPTLIRAPSESDSFGGVAALCRGAAQGIETVAAVWRAPIEGELVKLAVIPSGARNDNSLRPNTFRRCAFPILRGRLVNQRTKEIGIRMALGADSGAVVRMVVSQCMLLVTIGGAVGAALALLVAPLFAHHVQALQPYDPTAYLGTLLLIAAASLGASLRPAQRATAVNPLSTLRCD